MFTSSRTRDSWLASLRTGRPGGAATLLCVLALVFNLVGSVVYAGSLAGPAGGDTFICHAGTLAENPAPADGGAARPSPVCPLCQVHAAAFAAPLAQAPQVAAAASADVMLRLVPPAEAPRFAAAAIRPGGARAPPSPL